jgi:hypothetical protein
MTDNRRPDTSVVVTAPTTPALPGCIARPPHGTGRGPGSHLCPAPGCRRPVSADRLMCRPHRGLDVWEVIATVRDNDGSMAGAAEYLEIPAGLVEAAVAYYGEYRDEIDR